MELSGQLHAPGRFTLGIRTPGIHWIGGWVGPRVCLDAVVKRKMCFHYTCQDLNPVRPASNLVSILTELVVPRLIIHEVYLHFPYIFISRCLIK
jgi:hypothetical protein